MLSQLQSLQVLISRGASAAGEMLFPPACAICGEEVLGDGALFCPACRVQLWNPAKNYCPRCAMPYPDLPNPEETCAACRADKPTFAAARAIGSYELALRDVVLLIKHRAFETLAMQTGQLLAERIAAAPFPTQPDLIAPVPMFWLKRLWRGTSPAETIAQTLASALKLPCVTDLVRCRRWMKKQSSLSATERVKNVKDAYRIGWGFDIQGATVLLVDDVVTTGSTCNAIARELKVAGVAQVYVASVARAAYS